MVPYDKPFYVINYLIISINSFLEAERAGIQPKMMPINVDTPTARMTEPRLTSTLR